MTIGKIILLNLAAFVLYTVVIGAIFYPGAYWLVGLIYFDMFAVGIQSLICFITAAILYSQKKQQKAKGFLMSGLLILSLGGAFLGLMFMG